MIIKVKNLVEHLQTLPPDAEVWEYNECYQEYHPCCFLAPIMGSVKKPSYCIGLAAADIRNWDGIKEKQVCLLCG